MKNILKNALLSFPTAALLVIGFLVMQGALDRLGDYLSERESYAQWVRESCLPRTAGESAIAKVEDGKLACRIYSNLDYGHAPTIVSAAVMERPQ